MSGPDMVVNVSSVLKVLVAWRAPVVCACAKVLVAQGPHHVSPQTNSPPTYHADKTTVAFLNLGLHKLLHIEDP